MDPLDAQRRADRISNLYQELEDQLMDNIIKHIKDYDQTIDSDDWIMQKLAELARLNQENIQIIAQAAGTNQDAVLQMLMEVAEETINNLEPAFQQAARENLIEEAVPVEKSRNIRQAISVLVDQAKDVGNLCNTTMLQKSQEAFLNILNRYTAAMVTGVESRQQAMRKCILDFNNQGISAFVDKRGRNWTPEAYVNMCMRTTSVKMAAEVQMARADDYGIDLVEVDSHPGARPKCAKDQGKIFDRSNRSTKYPHWNTSSYGKPDGILGINCGHHIYPYIEGVSIRRYFPTEDMDTNNKIYKDTQVQRALERGVRKQKRECMLYAELGDREAYRQSSKKLKEKEAQLKKYVDSKSYLHRRKDREYVVGFDEKIPKKSAADKKAVGKHISTKKPDIRDEIKEIADERKQLKEKLSNFEKQKKEHELKIITGNADEMQSSFEKAKVAGEAINDIKKRIADLESNLFEKQDHYKTMAEKRIMKSGAVKEVKLSKRMTPDAVDGLEKTIYHLKEKYGIMPERIVYSPLKVPDGTASYDWLDDTIYLSNRFNDPDAYLNLIEKAEGSFVEYRKHYNIVEVAKSEIKEADAVLKNKAATKPEKEDARISKVRAQVKLNTSRQAVRKNLYDVVVHEYGHFIHRHSNNDFVERKNVFRMKDLGGKMINGDWMFDVNRIYSATGLIEASKISDYATKNPYETFAEGFLAMEKGESIPESIANVIIEAMKLAGVKKRI